MGVDYILCVLFIVEEVLMKGIAETMSVASH